MNHIQAVQATVMGPDAKAITWFQEKVKDSAKNVAIVACIAAAMEGSRQRLEATEVQFYAAHWLKRGISDYYTGEALDEAVECMKRLENELAPKIGTKDLDKYRFGFKRTEAVYAYENGNLPNNVFPIFWWPELISGRRRLTLFSRLS